jgi:hypothetical protein
LALPGQLLQLGQTAPLVPLVHREQRRLGTQITTITQQLFTNHILAAATTITQLPHQARFTSPQATTRITITIQQLFTLRAAQPGRTMLEELEALEALEAPAVQVLQQ